MCGVESNRVLKSQTFFPAVSWMGRDGRYFALAVQPGLSIIHIRKLSLEGKKIPSCGRGATLFSSVPVGSAVALAVGCLVQGQDRGSSTRSWILFFTVYASVNSTTSPPDTCDNTAKFPERTRWKCGPSV